MKRSNSKISKPPRKLKPPRPLKSKVGGKVQGNGGWGGARYPNGGGNDCHGARPEVPVDLDLVERLTQLQCTEAEVASVVGITPGALSKKKQKDPVLASILEQGKDRGRAALRRTQFKIAEKGNAFMAVHLGKHYLGQTDKIEQQPINPVVNVNLHAEIGAAFAAYLGEVRSMVRATVGEQKQLVLRNPGA